MRTLLMRCAVVTTMVAAMLVPALGAPATTITVPITVARSVHALSAHHQRVQLGYPASHVAFSWSGPNGTAIRFRTISSEGDVSVWSQAPEVHGPGWAERSGRHFSAMLAVDDVVEVEWSGVGRGANSIDRVTLDYLDSVDGPRREVQIPSVAMASGSPPVVTRAQWGADESLRTNKGCSRSFHKLSQIFVHHTAGKNYDSNPKATMRAIYWFHVVRQGWCDIGYNFVVGPEGTVFEGRWARRYKPWELHSGESATGRVVSGAHTLGYNSGSLGVSLMGNYSQIPLPPAARRSLVQLLAWEVDRHELDPRGKHRFNSRSLDRISGHRDAGQTACPGSFIYKDLPEIRREVEIEQGRGRVVSRISLAPEGRSVTYGGPARFSGTLEDSGGEPLAGRPIASYVREGTRRWRAGTESLTDAEGNFTLEVPVRRNTKVIAVYEGDQLTWGAQSKISGVRVAPHVTIESRGGTTAGDITHYPSGTMEVELAGAVEPPHIHRWVRVQVDRLESGEYQRVATANADLDDSSAYSFGFVPDAAGGTYRAVAVFTADEDHGWARSEPVTFIVDP